MKSFTFVTAIMVKEETWQTKMDSLRLFLNSFCALAQSLFADENAPPKGGAVSQKKGLGKIIIFADRDCAEILNFTYVKKSNITIILFNMEEDSWIYQASLPYKDRLPFVRNSEKDTFEHVTLTQMKVEFLQKAIEMVGESAGIFAWIDPNICHLFPNPLSSINYLNYLSRQTFIDSPFIALPGCWDQKGSVDFNNVCWRFCGSFLIGDAASIRGLNVIYKHFYPVLLKEKNTMTWEVNMWAQLEIEGVFTPVWYKANHDASIANIPTSLYSQNLSENDCVCIEYKYPEIPGFFPSSASHIKGIAHILITRYVNYKIGPDGRYTIFHPQGQLRTMNLLSTLSDDLTMIEDSHFIDENAIGIPTYMEGRYAGLEDVRLFGALDGGIGFVASSASYTPNNSIRVVRGTVQSEVRGKGKTSFVKGVVLQPPDGVYTPCEKNWIPLDKPDCYIYRWHPYEIVHVDGEKTMVISSKVISNTLFENVRGSTVPIWSEMDSCYICLVHWSKEPTKVLEKPTKEPTKVFETKVSETKVLTKVSSESLQYYHMLVKLDQEYSVTSWSQPFHFTKIGIQYCLGFVLIDPTTYGFWFSENDGNPKFMRSCSSQFSFE